MDLLDVLKRVLGVGGEHASVLDDKVRQDLQQRSGLQQKSGCTQQAHQCPVYLLISRGVHHVTMPGVSRNRSCEAL